MVVVDQMDLVLMVLEAVAVLVPLVVLVLVGHQLQKVVLEVLEKHIQLVVHL